MKIKNLFAKDKLFPLLIIWLVNLMVLSQAKTKHCHIRKFQNNLADFPTGCTYVIGFLDLFLIEINTDRAFKILDSIEYVTEYIRIYDLFRSPRVFSMKSLRAIYGRKLYDGRYSLIFDRLQKVDGIDFRNLTEISAGDVGFIENYGLCNAPFMILWTELFAKPDTQSVDHQEADLDDYECTEEATNLKNCHDLCDKLDGKSYCYGPEKVQCQKRTQCRKTKGCDRCLTNYYRVESCCSDVCGGGCSDGTALGCFVCKENKYNHNGKCLHRCPKSTFIMNNLCVDSCPRFLIKFQNDANEKFCVSSCPASYSLNATGFCEKCSSNGCPKTCSLTYPNGDHIERLNRTTLRAMHGCTHLIGSLIIDRESFLNEKFLTVEDFNGLSNLAIIEGILVLDFEEFPPHLIKDPIFEYVFFLGSLREIDGVQTESVQHLTSGFYNTPFAYIYLKSLKRFNVDKLIFNNNPNLLYLKTPRWTQNFGVGELVFDKVKDAGCPQICRNNYGCWGPNYNRCVQL